MADLLMKMPIPYEPKRQNRFILRFPSSLGINEWFVETAARPSIKIAATEIQFIDLEMLDPTGVVVEKWILYGTFLTDVNFGSLSYATDALADITCSLRMDRCVLVY